MTATLVDQINDMLDDEDGMRCVAVFTVAGEPLSKARARFTRKGHTYTPDRTKAAEAKVRAAYFDTTQHIERDTDAAFRVEAGFYCGTRQRRDVDNMLKLILDGLNGIAWPDDVQVLEIAGSKSFVPKAEARTEVAVFRLEVGMEKPTQPCIRCGTPFRTYDSWLSNPGGKKYCSRACAYAHRVEIKERVCEHCGTSFLGKQSTTRFCSRECASSHGRQTIACAICGTEFVQFKSWVAQGRVFCSKDCHVEHQRLRARERRATTVPGTCVHCGGGTTRKEYRRCNACKAAGKPLPPKELTP